MLILDANVILRYLLDDNEEMSKKADELIGKKEIYIPAEVIAEIVYVLSGVYGIDRKVISEILLNLLNVERIISLDINTIKNALNYYVEYNIDFVDSLLIGYVKNEHYEVFTFDKKLQKLILHRIFAPRGQNQAFRL